MTDECNTTKYPSLTWLTSLLATDQLIVVREGVAYAITVANAKAALTEATTEPPLDTFISIQAARDVGLKNGDKFMAAKPNKMACPPGTIIELI